MPSDDELRRVAEDVRALARSLARDFRSATDRMRDDSHSPGGSGGARSSQRRSAREDFADAGRAARREFRRARAAFRRSTQQHYPAGEGAEGADDIASSPLTGPGWGPGYPPRWDNWGRRPQHQRDRAGVGAGVAPRGRGGPGEDWAGGHGPGHRHRAGRPTRSQGAVAVPARAAKATPVPPPPLRHRHDGSTLFGLLAVVFGLAWLAAATHLANVSMVAVAAIALMVVGVATVVTARTDWALSRRSWPVLGGAALAAALLVFSVSPNLPVGFQHLSFGDRTVTPTTWAELPTTVHGGFGRTLIDLTALSGQPPRPTTLSVDDAAGQIQIMLPPLLKVVVDATVAAGQINVNGQSLSGAKRSANVTLNPGTPGPALTLKVRSGFGSTVIGPRAPLVKAPDGSGDISAVPSPTSTIPTPATPQIPAPPATPAAVTVP